jgi:hypothetical protein
VIDDIKTTIALRKIFDFERWHCSKAR